MCQYQFRLVPISNTNVCPSRTVSASSVSPGKPICGSNYSLSKQVSNIIFYPSKPIIGSSIRSSKATGASSSCSSKPIFGSNVRASKLICVLMFVQVNLLINILVLVKFVQVKFVQVNLFVLIMSVQVDLSVEPDSDSNIYHKNICSIHIVLLIHHYQLNRYHLCFYFPFQHFRYVVITIYLRSIFLSICFQ